MHIRSRRAALCLAAAWMLTAAAGCGPGDRSATSLPSVRLDAGQSGLTPGRNKPQCLDPIDTSMPQGPQSAIPEDQVADLRDVYFEAFPIFESTSISGTGTQLIDLPEGAWAGVITLSTQAESRLTVCTVTSRGEPSHAILSTSRKFNGTLLYGLDGTRFSASHDPQDDITQILVESDAPWTIDTKSVRDLPRLHSPISGNGNFAFWRDKIEGNATLSYSGKQKIRITQYYNYASPRLEIDTSNSPRRSFTFYTGLTLTIVESTGPWSLE